MSTRMMRSVNFLLYDINFASQSRRVDGDGLGEHWAFSTNNIQLQGVNCHRCGNYKCVSQSAPLTLKIKCECKSAATGSLLEEDDMYALPEDNDSYSYTKELASKMVLYEQMCAFMDVEKEHNLLCEDVVGVILDYL